MTRRNTLFALPFVTAFCLSSGGCAPKPTPSDDSRYLAEQIVPRLISWAKGSGLSLDLSKMIAGKSYDDICFVVEYSSLKIIEQSLGSKVATYHGDFGRYVPELKWAIVAVKDGEAHAALGDGATLNINMVPGRLCTSANRAILVRLDKPDTTIPTARLNYGELR